MTYFVLGPGRITKLKVAENIGTPANRATWQPTRQDFGKGCHISANTSTLLHPPWRNSKASHHFIKNEQHPMICLLYTSRCV